MPLVKYQETNLLLFNVKHSINNPSILLNKLSELLISIKNSQNSNPKEDKKNLNKRPIWQDLLLQIKKHTSMQKRKKLKHNNIERPISIFTFD